MGSSGFEPPTLRLSGARSNHLSYEPLHPVFCALFLFPESPLSFQLSLSHFLYLDAQALCLYFLKGLPAVLTAWWRWRGSNPWTPCLQSRCSPNWATPPFFSCSVRKNPQNWTTTKLLQVLLFLKSYFTWNILPYISVVISFLLSLRFRVNVFRLNSCLLRKEVIQPHLPIRLPCYDLTPITSPTFGSALLAVRLRTSGVPDSHGVTGGVYKARERIHRGMLIRDY